MVWSPQAGRPRQAAACPFHMYVCTYIERYRGWPTQPTPRPVACLFPLYVCMHTYGEMMGPRQPAPGRLLAFPFCM